MLNLLKHMDNLFFTQDYSEEKTIVLQGNQDKSTRGQQTKEGLRSITSALAVQQSGEITCTRWFCN